MRRRALTTLVTLGALLLVAIAGRLVYRTVVNEMGFEKAELGMPDPRALAEGVTQKALDTKASPIRSPLVVIRAEPAGATGPVVALGKPVGPELTGDRAIDPVFHGILARELVRQAMLIAAREELGLATRDAVLGDQVSAIDPGEAVGLESVFQPGVAARAVVRRAGGEKTETLLDSDLIRPLEIERDGIHGYSVAKLTTAAERLSRTDFPNALKRLGLERRPPRVQAKSSLPEGTDERLARLGFVDQFMAVRALHAAIRTDGESPERLGALVRGYAHLGLLTDYHLSPAYKAYRARALLYAQRLAARDPKSAWAFRHRAYAEALAGLPADALADLAEAERLAGPEDATDRPDWVELIHAFCKYDMRRLASYKGRHEPLACLLGVVSFQYPRTSRVVQSHGKRLLALIPDSFRALDDMIDTRRAEESKKFLSDTRSALDELVPKQLQALRELPVEVRRQVEPVVKPTELKNALREAGAPSRDAGEPSWSTLSQMLHETRFALTIRRLHWLQSHQAQGVPEWLVQSRPLFADHPCRRYLDFIAAPQHSYEGAAEFVRQLEKTDLDVSSYYVLAILRMIHDTASDALIDCALEHADPVNRDVADLVVHFPYEVHDEKESISNGYPRSVDYARALLKISPYSPLARAVLIAKDSKEVGPRIAQWEDDAGDDLLVLDALASRCMAAEEFEKARDYLLRYNRVLADGWSYRELARAYEGLGDTPNWRNALQESLRFEESERGDLAKAQTALAYYHADRKEWALALPLAESAARSGSVEGIQCALACYEQKPDLDKAELWTRILTQRDPFAHAHDWYLFCKRHGRNADMAYRYSNAFTKLVFNGVPPQYERNGYLHWLGGDPKAAYADFQSGVRPKGPKSFTLSAAFPLILLAQDLRNEKLRDELLDEVGKTKTGPTPELVRLFKIYRAQLAEGKLEKVDVETIEALIEGAKPENRGAIAFFAAGILERQGDRKNAKAYYRRCMKLPGCDPFMQVIAIDTVRVWVRSDPHATPEERSELPE